MYKVNLEFSTVQVRMLVKKKEKILDEQKVQLQRLQKTSKQNGLNLKSKTTKCTKLNNEN